MIVSAFLALGGETELGQVVDAARTLESAGAVAVGLLDAADTGRGAGLFESTTLAARVATQTTTVGVVASNSALYGFPFHAARRLATLDHLAAGRSGWLLRTVTATQEATAYEWRSAAGRGEELHRSGEYAEIALELWNSWEDGAQWPDKSAGDFKDDSRIHPIDYRSTSFRVAGPLDVPPSPQRRPVLFAEVSTPDEVVGFVPYVDVAIVVASDEATAVRLAKLVAAESARQGAPTTVLIAGAVAGAVAVLAADAAVETVGASGAAGVALYLDPSDAAEAAAVVSAAASAAPVASATSTTQDGTLAAALGIESVFVLGGRAA